MMDRLLMIRLWAADLVATATERAERDGDEGFELPTWAAWTAILVVAAVAIATALVSWLTNKAAVVTGQ